MDSCKCRIFTTAVCTSKQVPKRHPPQKKRKEIKKSDNNRNADDRLLTGTRLDFVLFISCKGVRLGSVRIKCVDILEILYIFCYTFNKSRTIAFEKSKQIIKQQQQKQPPTNQQNKATYTHTHIYEFLSLKISRYVADDSQHQVRLCCTNLARPLPQIDEQKQTKCRVRTAVLKHVTHSL